MRWPQQAPFKQALLKTRLRRSALRFARHGWAVTPGGYFNGEQMACDRSDCLATSCHPVLPDWESQSSTFGAQIDEWWKDQAHAVLLPTGHTFDVIEVPSLLGSRAVCGPTTGPGGASAVGRLRAPVAVTPNGRWMFLVQPGPELLPELGHRMDIVRHGPGSWIPAPPTLLPDGFITWEVDPDTVRWRLPRSEDLQGALVSTLVTLDAAFLDLPLSARRRTASPRLGRTAAMEVARRAV